MKHALSSFVASFNEDTWNAILSEPYSTEESTWARSDNNRRRFKRFELRKGFRFKIPVFLSHKSIENIMEDGFFTTRSAPSIETLGNHTKRTDFRVSLFDMSFEVHIKWELELILLRHNDDFYIMHNDKSKIFMKPFLLYPLDSRWP